MAVVNMHDAKTHLSRLVDRAQEGEDIVIARAGRPVARLVALSSDRERPTARGMLRGRLRHLVSPEDADAAVEELLHGNRT
jgi:prevent-host-death family protein